MDKRFGRIICGGLLGQPITFIMSEVQDVRPGAGDYGWEGLLLIGKKKVTVMVSPLKLAEGAKVYITNGQINGGIWFDMTDQESAEKEIRSKVREALMSEMEKVKVSLRSTK